MRQAKQRKFSSLFKRYFAAFGTNLFLEMTQQLDRAVTMKYEGSGLSRGDTPFCTESSMLSTAIPNGTKYRTTESSSSARVLVNPALLPSLTPRRESTPQDRNGQSSSSPSSQQQSADAFWEAVVKFYEHLSFVGCHSFKKTTAHDDLQVNMSQRLCFKGPHLTQSVVSPTGSRQGCFCFAQKTKKSDHGIVVASSYPFPDIISVGHEDTLRVSKTKMSRIHFGFRSIFSQTGSSFAW